MPPTFSDSAFNRELQISVGTGNCRTSTASSRSQWALPDLNRERQISAGIAGPQPRAPDLSGHCRTLTASVRCQLLLREFNGEGRPLACTREFPLACTRDFLLTCAREFPAGWRRSYRVAASVLKTHQKI